MAHFEKDVLMHIQPDLEGQGRYATSISQVKQVFSLGTILLLML